MNTTGRQPEKAIQSWARCVSCGYALAGLPPDGSCPECNTPVRRSLHSRDLRHADERWLRRITIGFDLVLVSFVAGLITLIVSEVISFVSVGGVVTGFAAALRTISDVVGPLLAVGGVFLITWPEPKDEDRHRRIALITRIAVIVFLFARVAALSISAAQQPAFVAAMLLLQPLAYIFVLIGVFDHVRRFGERALMSNVAAQARLMQWTLPLVIGLLGLGAGVLRSGALSGVAPSIVVGLAFVFSLLCLGVMGIWSAGVLLAFRIKLSNHIQSVR